MGWKNNDTRQLRARYKRGLVYTNEMIAIHVRRLALRPAVRPTAAGNGEMVLGLTPGRPADPAFPADPPLPRLPLFGCRIGTRPDDNPGVRLVVAAGNHGGEYSGNWLLQGLADFLAGDDPRARRLRQLATAYIYPCLNPEGRYLAVHRIRLAALPAAAGRNNSELAAAGAADHNRAWHTRGRFSTVEIIATALKRDTGGEADYCWDLHDLHDPGNWRSPTASWSSPYGRALRRREPRVVTLGVPGGPEPDLYRDPAAHRGKFSCWVAGEAGLRAKHSFVYESGEHEEEALMAAGRNIVLALHDVLA